MPGPKIDRQNRPLIVAHRGASATHPENTLASFQAAIEAGADMVELDVRMTLDGVPIILHDADVSTRTDGTGFCCDLTLEELKRLDASKGRGPRTEIPTLAEALEFLSGRIAMDIEVKNYPGDPGFDSPVESAVEATLRALGDLPFEGDVLLCSFNWQSIERVKQRRPDLPTGFLTVAQVDPREALEYARSNGHEYVLPQAPAVFEAGSAFVEEAHAAGIGVGTWTVDDPEAMGRLFAMGVDAIATNDPVTGIAVRDRFRERPV